MFLLNKSIFVFAFTVLLFINNVYTESTTIPDDNDYTTIPVSADDYTTVPVSVDDYTTIPVSADNDYTTTVSTDNDYTTTVSKDDNYVTTPVSADNDYTTTVSKDDNYVTTPVSADDHYTTTGSADNDYTTTVSKDDNYVTTPVSADDHYTTTGSADNDYTTTGSADNDYATTPVSADDDDTTTPITDDESTRASRIVGGEPDRYDEVKYSVVIHDGYQDFCGGSIIAERFILTAAHCVIGHDNQPIHYPLYTLIGGTNRLLSAFRDRVPKVEKIFVPESFIGSRGAIQFGDIAVLRLDRPVRLLSDMRIDKVNLPVKMPNGYWDSYEGKIATIAGFGANGVEVRPNDEEKKVDLGKKFYPGNLVIGRVQVLPQRDCEDIFSGFINIHMAHMCARMLGFDYRGVCSGDAGNGLVWNNTLIAVASFGNELCYEGAGHAPGVYTRVAPYMHFIEMAMANAPSIDLRVYYMFRRP